MAEIRSPFPTLVDSNGVGQVLTAASAGQAAASIVEGSVGFAYKDASGNLVLPQLTSAGAVPIALTMNNFSDAASAGGSTSAFVQVCAATLNASKTYAAVEATLTCYQDTLAQVIKSDNGVQTVLGYIQLGPGQYSYKFDSKATQFSTGATGAQLLLISAKNLLVASDLHGSVACVQTN
jgi:hypothetical protein